MFSYLVGAIRNFPGKGKRKYHKCQTVHTLRPGPKIEVGTFHAKDSTAERLRCRTIKER